MIGDHLIRHDGVIKLLVRSSSLQKSESFVSKVHQWIKHHLGLYICRFLATLSKSVPHHSIGIIGTFLLISACSAQPQQPNHDNPHQSVTPVPLHEGTKAGSSSMENSPNLTAPEKGVMSRPSREETDVESSVEKSPPTQKQDATPRPSAERENPPAQSRPQPCQGMPTNAVSPRVQEFLTCELIQILAQPERIRVFRVKPEPDTSVPAKERLGSYPIESEANATGLNAEQLKKLQLLLFSEKSYVFDAEKRCRFRPEMGLHFVKGEKAVDILFSFLCDSWLFVHKDQEKLEDFDPVRKELVDLRNVLFPNR